MKAGASLLLTTAILALSNIANAALIDGISWSNDYRVIDINADDTLVGSVMFSNGIINNKGQINADGAILQGLSVTLNNDGNIFFQGGITAGGLTINNSPSGLIVFTNYIDAYQASTVENAGTIVIADALGNGTGSSNGSWMPFTYMYEGLIHNTGKFLIQRNNHEMGYDGGAACEQWNKIMTFRNDGYLEIASGSKCDFGLSTPSQRLKATFIQDSGETRVNGRFGAHEILVNKGVLSGNGILHGGQINPTPTGLGAAVTIAPGAPIGTLSLVSDDAAVRCDGCSVNIELAGADQFDQLHITGEFDVVRWKLNVSLRDGYVPAPGTQFSVISADVIVSGNNALTTYNLPKLPSGRTWRVEYIDNQIILTAN